MRTASSPSFASPMTLMCCSSSMIRRKPRRTSAWSSTRRTEILPRMLFHLLPWNSETNQGAAFARPQGLHGSTQDFRALTDRNQSDSTFRSPGREPFPVVFHIELERVVEEAEADPGPVCAGMPRHVVQRFLHDAIDVNTAPPGQRERSAGFFVGDGDTGMPLDCGQ